MLDNSSLQIVLATESDLPRILPLVGRYHHYEAIESSDEGRQRALTGILRDASLGFVWIVLQNEIVCGYVAICFCYSIEFGGQDCFIDEFFIEENHRGVGLGGALLAHVICHLRGLGVRAINLEVAKTGACAFYAKHEFTHRDRYGLMTLRL